MLNLLPSFTKSILPIVLLPFDNLMTASADELSTCNLAPGDKVPMPILPLFCIVFFSVSLLFKLMNDLYS